MNRIIALACVLSTGALIAGSAADASAQYVTYYRPMTTFYAPAVAVAPAPIFQPAPVAWTVGSPVVVESAAPVVAAPAVVAPAVPVVTYFRPPVVSYAAVPQVVTRFRPILGGTVSRVRYSYMPVVY